MTISAIVNTRNEEKNIVRCLRSISPYVDEIVVVDMESSDTTVALAKDYTKKVFTHKNVDYVEPARNFAITKAVGDWIMLLDADEVMPEALGLKLRQFADADTYDYFRIARKNLIFGRWIKHSGWWPDYQIRFFKKNAVSWNDEIHSVPITQGKGTDLPLQEEQALTHYHYNSVEQFVERLNRYSSQEAKQFIKEGVVFEWKNVITKPTGEFLTRYFMWEGYKDGLHGLALSLLQSFSFLIVQLKLWQNSKFTPVESAHFLDESVSLLRKSHADIMYWYSNKKNENKKFTRTLQKIRQRIKL